MTNLLRVSVVMMAGCSAAAAQARVNPVQPGFPPLAKAAAPAPQSTPPAETPSDYILGAEDRIVVYSPDFGEVSGKTLDIASGGFIDLPLCGRLQVAGKTLQELQAEIVARLRQYVREPSVTVTVAEFHSQSVSVWGCVNQPGVRPLEGNRTLVEIISQAGGVRTDAGYTVQVTRSLEWGRIPLLSAKDDPSGRFSVAEVRLDAIMGGKHPEENILVKPHDVISVPRARLIYVIGNVPRAGGFVLEERESMSVLQALALAGGMSPQSAPGSAKILRGGTDAAKRTEVPVDLKKIMTGQQEDIAMKAEDILYVPSSTAKKAGIRAAEAVLSMATGVIVWRAGAL
jgi:polysaccharide export outer membrane protein